MPKVRLTNRTLLWVYDRYDGSGVSRRKRLHKTEVTEISEKTLALFTKRGIRFEIIEDSKESKDKTVDETTEPVKDEVELTSETVSKKVSKKKKKKKKKVSKTSEA